jgi:4-amino-4-deoxy-L-arabinose transferase-like glycosyltransferase
MARRLAGGCAAVAAVCLFMFSTLVFRYTTYYQYEIPLAFLTAFSGYLLFFSPRTAGVTAVAGAGAVLGFAALCSPRVLALLPLIAFCVFIWKDKRRAAVASAVLLVGITAVLLPWTVRNLRCYDQWIVTTTNGGINLYIGNNPHSTGGYHLPPKDVRPPHAFYESGLWIREAAGYVAGHPAQTLGRSVLKGLKFWNPHYGDQFLVLLLFLMGWVRLLRTHRRWDSRLLWIIAVPFVFTLVHAVFFVQVRYMIPALPMVSVVAGAGACGWRPDNTDPVT